MKLNPLEKAYRLPARTKWYLLFEPARKIRSVPLTKDNLHGCRSQILLHHSFSDIRYSYNNFFSPFQRMEFSDRRFFSLSDLLDLYQYVRRFRSLLHSHDRTAFALEDKL